MLVDWDETRHELDETKWQIEKVTKNLDMLTMFLKHNLFGMDTNLATYGDLKNWMKLEDLLVLVKKAQELNQRKKSLEEKLGLTTIG